MYKLYLINLVFFSSINIHINLKIERNLYFIIPKWSALKFTVKNCRVDANQERLICESI